jgi:hypothetical protein
MSRSAHSRGTAFVRLHRTTTEALGSGPGGFVQDTQYCIVSDLGPRALNEFGRIHANLFGVVKHLQSHIKLVTIMHKPGFGCNILFVFLPQFEQVITP